MKILVLGGSSLLGSRFVKMLSEAGNDVQYTFNKLPLKVESLEGIKLDATNRQETIELIQKIKPEIVIDTVAVRGTDVCETNKNLADRVNVNATQNIMDACKSTNSYVVYMSTAFVFDGKKDNFTEDDQPNPINYYGKTKLDGEIITLNSGLPHLIIRTDQLYGWTLEGQPENTVTKTIKKLEKNETVEEISDWYNNPTLVDNASEVIVNLVKKEKAGIYHVVGSDFLNRVEWALKIAKIFGLDETLIKSKDSSKLNLPAKRPNANLFNIKAQNDSGVKLLNVEDGLKFMRNQMKND